MKKVLVSSLLVIFFGEGPAAAYTLPKTNNFVMEINELERFQDHWAPHSANKPVRCTGVIRMRFPIENASSQPQEIAVTENWLTTIGTTIKIPGVTPEEGVAVQNLFHPGSDIFSIIPHGLLVLPPGKHMVYVEHTCLVVGYLELKIFGLHGFVEESVGSNAKRLIVTFFFLALAIYAMAFWIVTRKQLYILFACLNMGSLGMVATYFLNSGTSLFDFHGVDNIKLEYIFFICFVGIVLAKMLRNRSEQKGYSTAIFLHLRNSCLVGPFFGFLMTAMGWDHIFHLSSIITTSIMAYACVSRRLYAEIVSMSIVMVTSLIAFAYFFGYFHQYTWLYWVYPVGLFLFNFSLFCGFLIEAYHYYTIAKKEKRKQHSTERNLAIANALQNKFMGSEQWENVATYFRPAEGIGGDWYRYFSNQDGSTFFIFMGDVTGHGIKSAHMTALVAGGMTEIKRDLSRLVNPSPEDLEEAVKFFNHLFYTEGNLHGLSMTLLAMAVNLVTGKVDLINICHPHPCIISEKGFRPMVSANKYLGTSEETQFKSMEFTVNPGEQIFMYTDGLLENGDDKTRITIRTLKKLFQKGKTPQENADSLLPFLAKWKTTFDDDVTLLLYRHDLHEKTAIHGAG